MRVIITAALVLGLSGPVAADDKKGDPVGTWKLEYTIGDMKRTSTLVVKKDGDKHVGTMSWPEQKDVKLKDVAVKDGELTFSADREVMDRKFTVKYKLKVDGDTLKGKGAVEANGESREFDIEAKREKKEK